MQIGASWRKLQIPPFLVNCIAHKAAEAVNSKCSDMMKGQIMTECGTSQFFWKEKGDPPLDQVTTCQ